MPKNKHQPGDVVDLDDANITPAALLAWNAAAQAAVVALAAGGVRVDPSAIPDEQAILKPDGSLEIFVEIPGGHRVSMGIPPGQWVFR